MKMETGDSCEDGGNSEDGDGIVVKGGDDSGARDRRTAWGVLCRRW